MCEYNVDFEDEIKRHMDETHGKFSCHMCNKLFWDSTVCNAHKDTCLVSITIKCKTCDFVTGKLAGLMKHKAEKHQFKCDKCEWKVSSSKELDQHKLYVHVPKEKVHAEKETRNSESIQETVSSKDLESEIVCLKKELKFVKNRFEQVLESHNDVEKDMEDMKKKYEEELAKVREDFVRVKAEKEHFRVRNELLQNMSKIIVEKCLNNNDETRNESAKIDEVSEEDDDISEFVNRMKRNQNLGYRRVSPADAPIKQKADQKTPGKKNERVFKRAEEPRADEDNFNGFVEKDDFCHFYNNYNKCLFEENTGKRCKFSHRKAPICNFDGQCGRSKCMYRHKMQKNNDDFLAPRNVHSQPHVMQHWGINPWAQPATMKQMPNPWMFQGKQNSQ